MKKNVKVILMKCERDGRLSGIRMEECSGGWCYTWAFPIKESIASKEGYGSTKISGSFFQGEDFNGCPYCGNTGYVRCGQCHKLTCWNGSEDFHCQWCGAEGKVSGTISELDAGQDY